MDWLADPSTWVFAVERAYVAAALAPQPADAVTDPARLVAAAAAAGAVASRYLAVGTPRSIGLVGAPEAVALSLAAHRVWFKPTDIRCTEGDLGRRVPLAEALAADIVCIHAPIALAARDFRRGTHVNVLVAIELDPELARVATVSREVPDLGRLAAGLVDGRQLDELTVFVLGDAAIAISALQRP